MIHTLLYGAPAGLGQDFVGIVQGYIVVAVAADAQFRTELVKPCLGSFVERVGVAVIIDGFGCGFADEHFQCGNSIALTDDQPAAEGAEIFCQ